MSKLPTKQIYLLAIIIAGIFTLSVYSTYSIFTLESETDNIVSLSTPSSIELPTETYEYKQIIVPKNSYIYTDIDLYNNTNDDLCYGVWYRIIKNNLIDENKVRIYENTNLSLTTSGVINSISSKRINLLIINDNEEDIKINIGLSHEQNNESCILNLTNEQKIISTTINFPKILSDTLIETTETKTIEEGYITYKNLTDIISINDNDKIYISNEFTYTNELFTLKEPVLINEENIENYLNTTNNNYYICLNNQTCQKLYQINSLKMEEEQIYIDKYNILIGYLNGENGLRKINNDYVYYGDNPNNFIYYNCKNELDNSTCELWRIIGFYYNEETKKYTTKIIRDSSIGAYSYNDENNLWNNSNIFNYLNKEYQINNDNLLTKITYKQQNIVATENETNIISYLQDENESLVTLMNLTDYLNASICKDKNISEYDSTCLNNNWLNKNDELNELTMTIKYELPSTDPETEELIIPDNNIVYSVGNNINTSLITDTLNIRPVAYLKNRILLINGNGTIDNPYIIK